MKEKERPILYLSLALNVVLIILLFLSNGRDQESTEIAALPDETTLIASVEYTPTYTPTPDATNTAIAPTATLPPVAISAPTNTPTPTVPPSPTPTFTPSATPTPSPTPSPTEPPPPEWLSYINTFRTMANLDPLENNPEWSAGSLQHSIYMVETDDITHDPDPGSQWYTDAARLAADNGNIAATEWSEASYIWAINYWMAAPFHGLPMLDPELTAVGFGFYSVSNSSNNNNNLGGVNVAATLDVLRGLVQPSMRIIQYPIFFPPDGGETWILKHSLYEYPDPLSSCPGYSRPSGPPIMIQTGTGSGKPEVTSYRFTANGAVATACMFHEQSYINSNPTAQQSGRGILNARDAIVIIPLNPLVVGSEYEVTVTVNGESYSSKFTAVEPPY